MRFKKFVVLLKKAQFSAAYQAFLAAVGADGGTAEAKAYTDALLQTASNASIVQIPSAYKAGTLYNQVPIGEDFTVVRASDVRTIGEDGVLRTLGSNVPGIDYTNGFPELLTQPQSTNLYLNSAVMVTQNVTTTATDYTVSFWGTGTITFSGTYAGSLVGTGATDRVEITFTATAGTLTSTVTGSCTNGQCEALGFASSHILTTGSSATRLKDVITDAGSTSSINTEEGVFLMEAIPNDSSMEMSISTSNTEKLFLIYNFSTSNKILYQYVTGGAITASINKSYTSIGRDVIAVVWKVNDFRMYVNGVSVGTDVSGAVGSANTFDTLNFSNYTGVAQNWTGRTKQLRVYRSIADAQADGLTYIT